MLTNDVKRNIDNARNVLVGKIPNPQSQIDQITTALIYKFMYDMDCQAKELGGRASFLTGDLKKYSWNKYFDDSLSADDKFNLYDDALRTFATAKQLPELFRQIFKDSFLPYRDSRVLRLFLKEINKFEYDHSEALGNGFEYLLSILGSQGDAGQFRTPRNIIDFIVEVIDPKKQETILDPACGTAGFLISSFKHIKKHNSTNFDPKTDLPTFMRKNKKDVHEIEIQENGKYKGDKLTSTQKKKLHENIHGYDISPDMVRLSRVNMYLHHIQKQNIVVYDTLSNTSKWEDDFDVVLANPPFMTPKGGIEPHKKFGVQARRSEVLFVDYIAEHIKTKGRGAVIVPEGIIFQSANAYKALRKNLIDGNVLYAVVSLPAGVFQPYSGVKTSILFFDKQLAKAKDEILFIKVENDGFDLGSRRTAHDKNDLGEAYYILKDYQKNKISKTSEIYKHINPDKIEKISCTVKKETIAADGDYNLSGDRYRETIDYSNVKWPMVKLGEVCDIYSGATPKKSESVFWNKGKIPWFTIEDIRKQGRVITRTKQTMTKKGFDNSSVKLLPKDTVLLCCTASVGECAITRIELTTNQQFNGLVVKDGYKKELLPDFLFQVARTFKDELIRLSGKTSFNFVSVGTLKKIPIPLPPLEVQAKIVKDLDRKSVG